MSPVAAHALVPGLNSGQLVAKSDASVAATLASQMRAEILGAGADLMLQQPLCGAKVVVATAWIRRAGWTIHVARAFHS